MKTKYNIQMVSIDDIQVVNSRERNEKSFQAVKGNIANVGLKKPVTIRPSDNGKGYDLVCGEGRLKSFIALGQKEIPAIIRNDLPKGDAYIMSLIENMARKQHTSMDLMRGIELLQNKGYGVAEISRKTGLASSYVSDILKLLNMGEERLISAVEKGHIPLTIATKIASSPGEEQQALQDAYEKQELRGKKFLVAQKLVEKRRTSGKGIKKDNRPYNTPSLSAREMVKKFQTEIDRMRSLVEKAETTNTTLEIIVEAFFDLLQDENFVTLLRAEGLNTMPEKLSDMIKERDDNDE